MFVFFFQCNTFYLEPQSHPVSFLLCTQKITELSSAEPDEALTHNKCIIMEYHNQQCEATEWICITGKPQEVWLAPKLITTNRAWAVTMWVQVHPKPQDMFGAHVKKLHFFFSLSLLLLGACLAKVCFLPLNSGFALTCWSFPTDSHVCCHC